MFVPPCRRLGARKKIFTMNFGEFRPVKIHLKQIPAAGLHLEGEEECPIREIEAEGIRCAGPLRYRLDLGVSDGALWANGSLAQAARIALRCLSRKI